MASTLRGFGYWVRSRLSVSPTMEFALSNLNARVSVGSRTLFARQLAKYRGYEAINSNWVLREFANAHGGLFVDVGANFGWYSLLFSTCAGPTGQVAAIEPDDANFALLRHNIEFNKLANVAALQVGVGASKGTAQLFELDRFNPGAHSVRPVEGACSARTIELHRLDELLAPFPGHISLLKMDIEGYEIDALLGAEATLARTQNVLVEYSPRFLKACGHTPGTLLTMLSDLGLAPHFITEFGLRPTSVAGVLQAVGDEPGCKCWQTDLVFQRTS